MWILSNQYKWGTELYIIIILNYYYFPCINPQKYKCSIREDEDFYSSYCLLSHWFPKCHTGAWSSSSSSQDQGIDGFKPCLWQLTICSVSETEDHLWKNQGQICNYMCLNTHTPHTQHTHHSKFEKEVKLFQALILTTSSSSPPHYVCSLLSTCFRIVA